MTGRPLVSIIIVNYNGKDWLADCLESLRRVTYPHREVLMVDNASTDGSVEILNGFPEVQLLASAENLGFAGGNNLAIKQARGEYLLLLNSDTVVRPNFLDPIVDYLQRHPRVGIVQSKMLLSRHSGVLDVCGSFLTAFGYLYHYGYWKQDAEKYSRNHAMFTAKGACMTLRRDLIPRVGNYLFNRDYFCFYEETDFCHRAWLAGYETHFVAGSVIEHLHGATAEQSQRKSFVLDLYLRNQACSLLSNLSIAWLLRILPGYAVLFLGGLVLGLLTGRFSLARSHWRTVCFCVKNLQKIRLQRRIISRIRVARDRDIFAKVMKTPRPSYFWKTFTGQLATYADSDLPATSPR